MNEAQILAACLHSRSAWETMARYIDPEDMSDRGQVVLQEIKDWYHVDPAAARCDTEVVLARVLAKHPKHEQVFKAIILQEAPPSPKNLERSFLEYKTRAISGALVQALAAQDTKAGTALAARYQDLVQGRLEAEEVQDTRVFRGASSDKLIKSVLPENLMKLHPASLNEALGGGLPRGSHTLIFAPPEVGKSMLSINISSGFLYDGRTVLYIGNEDPAELMLLRFKSRLSNMTREEMLADTAKADAIAEKHGFNNLIFASTSPGGIKDIEQLCDEYHPDVLVVDQMSNLWTPNLTKVEGLEWLAKQLRRICKARNIVGISITQAADSAQGKLYLDMGDVYFSNVAIQAQVDVMIGIGMDKTAEAAGIRVLSLCKNKLNGNHAPVQVSVRPDLSKVT